MTEEQNTQQATGIKNAELFDNVLDKNEQVLRVIKPNKLKLFVYWFLSAFWINVWDWGAFLIQNIQSGLQSLFCIPRIFRHL